MDRIKLRHLDRGHLVKILHQEDHLVNLDQCEAPLVAVHQEVNPKDNLHKVHQFYNVNIEVQQIKDLVHHLVSDHLTSVVDHRFVNQCLVHVHMALQEAHHLSVVRHQVAQEVVPLLVHVFQLEVQEVVQCEVDQDL